MKSVLPKLKSLKAYLLFFWEEVCRHKNKYLIGVLGLIFLLLSRFPQLSSQHLLPDGDESIVGLMALDLLNGDLNSMFFYGQSYGFALVEVLFLAVGFSIFGCSPVVIKLSTLSLWSVGLVFFVLAVRRLSDQKTAFITALVMTTFSGFYAWSMNPWGGTVTAFLLTGICFYTLTLEMSIVARRRYARSSFSGALAFFIFLSHPLWIMPLGACLCWYWLKNRDKKEPIFFFLSLIFLAAIFYFFILNSNSYWKPEVFKDAKVGTALYLLPDRLMGVFSGNYFLNRKILLGLGSTLYGYLCLVLLICSLSWVFARAVLKKEFLTIELFIALGIFGSIVVSLFMNNIIFGNRYLIPLTPFFLVLVALSFHHSQKLNKLTKLTLPIILVLMSLLGLYTNTEYSEVSFDGRKLENLPSDEKTFRELLAALSKNNISLVYSLDPMFQWNIMLASKKKILARWYPKIDRDTRISSEFIKKAKSGEPAAVVGKYHQRDKIFRFSDDSDDFRQRLLFIDQRYFIFLYPERKLIQTLGFK